MLQYILFLLCFVSTVMFSSPEITVGKTDTPNFVEAGSNYTISSKLTLQQGVEQIEVFLHTDFNSALKNVQFNSRNNQRTLRYYRVEGQSPLDKIYKIESGRLTQDEITIGQLVFTLNTQNSENASLFVTEEDPSFTSVNWDENIHQIKIYNSSEIAGKCLRLNPNSRAKIDIDLTDQEQPEILFEFWAELKLDSAKFFSVHDQLGNEITSLARNSFGYIEIPSFLDAELYKETYLDKNSWNYYLVKLNYNRGYLKIYVNDEIYFTGPIYKILNQNSIQFAFANTSGNGFIRLERLKAWSFGNNEAISLANKNFNHYQADSSKLVILENFNSNNTSEKVKIEGNFTQEQSTAPIFSRAPVLKASVFNQSFNLTWEISDISNVKAFEIEKSYDGGKFSLVNTVNVADNNKTQFSFSDYDVSKNQIIYYRVKQINEDGTEILSSSVKVGRGKQTHFKVNQNYPNPFNPVTTVAVDVQRTSEFIVRVYDIVGNVIEKLHEGTLAEGTHRFDFNGSDLPSGLYFFEVKSEDELEVMKMILAK